METSNKIPPKTKFRSIVREVQITTSNDSICSAVEELINTHHRSPSVSSVFRTATDNDDLQTTKRSFSCDNLLCHTQTNDSGTGDSVAELPIQPVNYIQVPIYGYPAVAYMRNRYDFDMDLVRAYQKRNETAARCQTPKSTGLRLFKSTKSAPPPCIPMIRNHLIDRSST